MQQPKAAACDPQRVRSRCHAAHSLPAGSPGCPILPEQHRCARHSGDELIAAGVEPARAACHPGCVTAGTQRLPAEVSSASAPRQTCHSPAQAVPPSPTGQRGTRQDAPRPGRLPASRLPSPAAGCAAFPTHTWHGEAAKLLSRCQGVPAGAGGGTASSGITAGDLDIPGNWAHCRHSSHQPPQTGQHSEIGSW